MCAELVMKKRVALPGEVGLFVNAEVFEEAFRTLKMDEEFTIKATVEAHAKYNRLSWHIANLVCESSEDFEYPDEARDSILIDCRHFKRKYDKLRDKAEIEPKPTKNLDGTAWLALIRRMVHIATTKYGIPEDAMSRQLQEAQRQDAARAAVPEPPPHEDIPEGPVAVSAGPDPAPPAAATSGRRGFDDDEGAREPEATPEPPQARQTTLTKPPLLPTDALSYKDYALGQLKEATDHAGFVTWWNSDEEWNLRKECRVTIPVRKNIESYISAKEWKT